MAKKTVTMAYPAYHNDMEYSEVEVLVVTKDGVEVGKPSGYYFGKEAWLNNVFYKEMANCLLSL